MAHCPFFDLQHRYVTYSLFPALKPCLKSISKPSKHKNKRLACRSCTQSPGAASLNPVKEETWTSCLNGQQRVAGFMWIYVACSYSNHIMIHWESNVLLNAAGFGQVALSSFGIFMVCSGLEHIFRVSAYLPPTLRIRVWHLGLANREFP